MRLDRVVVDEDLSAFCAIIAVVVGRERQVMTGHEVFGEDPGQMRLAHADIARFLQRRCGDGLELFPCFRRRDACFFQCIDVVVHDRRGRVERHADHLAIAIGVEITHAGDVIIDVEVDAIVGQQVLNRDGCAFGSDHGGGASVKHLHDVGLLARTEGGDACGQGFLVGAFEHGGDLVIILRGIEVFGDLVDRLAELAAHCVPEGDFGFGKCCAGRNGNSDVQRCNFPECHRHLLVCDPMNGV